MLYFKSLDIESKKTISETFNKLKSSFTQVWKELQPNGKGLLSLIIDQSKKEDNYMGIKIEVSFLQGGVVYLLEQLSGGQKAIVTVAFILALQVYYIILYK